MSSREFARWIAFDREETIGARRDDVRWAVLASLIAEANRDTKRRSQPYRPGEFLEMLPSFEDEDDDPGASLPVPSLPLERGNPQATPFLHRIRKQLGVE